MAEETQTKAEEVVVVAETEKTAIETDTPPAPAAKVPEVEEPIKPAVVEGEAAAPAATLEAEKAEKAEATVEETVDQAAAFQEESNVVSDLPDPEKKALEELKQLIQEALNKNDFTAPPPPPPAAKEEEKPAEEEKKAETEETPAPAAAEVKAEATEEAVAEASTTAEAAPVETSDVAEPAPVEEVKEEKKEEAKAPEPESAPEPEAAAEAEAPAAVVVAEVVETVTTVDEDGAKTVEAIEETIVAVSAPAAPAEEPAAATPEKEAEGESTSAAPAETKEEEIADAAAPPSPTPEEVSIWGVPLLADERSDAILLKFLRARDFKVKDAFAMIKATVGWRKEFGIETLLEEDLGNDLEKAVFMYGFDKEGHPVCYNVYGEFQSKELYQKAFSDEEKRQKFLRWRIQFLEKSIQKLDFSPDGICTIVQVNDLKNSPGLAKRELRLATRQALLLLQDNYPEFVAKQVFINVPWWYLAFNRMISPFLTQRTKSKFVFAGPSKTAETLFKYIAPEQVPVQYGGLSREGEQEFSTSDAVIDVTVKPTSKHTVEIPVTETSLLVWELRVLGWDVSYGAEFVPSAEDGYTVIVQKTRNITPTDEPVLSNSFKIGEPGKVVLTIDNTSSKKKKLLYRFKTKPFSD
ncbi:patellin-3-like [Macadamia integrifolia]|uniref:patellin-3-like n=1 Tax=Macadamia integrifolia TaxID=60698 RepID=UPI001C4F20FE|nr:patellin-3-like [Macadamia integrifolia]